MKKKYFIILVLFLITKISFAQAEAYLGEIKLFSGNFPPRGWALCNGQILPINQNQALFSLLGTAYGGNGISTFALPDLRGRVVRGEGGAYTLGQSSNSQSATVLQANMPAHVHQVPLTISSASGTNNVPSTNSKIGNPVLVVNGIPRTGLGYNSGAPDVALKGTTTTATVGGSIPFNTQQPSLGLVYIIAIQGIFPSPN